MSDCCKVPKPPPADDHWGGPGGELFLRGEDPFGQVLPWRREASDPADPERATAGRAMRAVRGSYGKRITTHDEKRFLVPGDAFGVLPESRSPGRRGQGGGARSPRHDVNGLRRGGPCRVDESGRMRGRKG